MSMHLDHVSPERDFVDLEEVEENGIKMNLKRGGSHGYWTIHYPKGRLPPSLEGQYTNRSLAEQAARNYLNSIRRDTRNKE